MSGVREKELSLTLFIKRECECVCENINYIIKLNNKIIISLLVVGHHSNIIDIKDIDIKRPLI